jgi:hypothetical protein
MVNSSPAYSYATSPGLSAAIAQLSVAFHSSIARARARRDITVSTGTPPSNVDALVAALEPLMRDPASALAMGARGHARALKKFSLDAEAAAIAEVNGWSTRLPGHIRSVSDR